MTGVQTCALPIFLQVVEPNRFGIGAGLSTAPCHGDQRLRQHGVGHGAVAPADLDCLCRILQIGKYQYLSAVGILERYRLYISVQTGGVDAHRTGIHKLADMAQGVIVNIIFPIPGLGIDGH